MSFLGHFVTPDEVYMEPPKIKAVVDWSLPASQRERQRALCFANFHHRFNCNDVIVAAPVMDSSKVRFCWNLATKRAFKEWKKCFTSAQIVCRPDPCRQFIVEVDASLVGMGSLLS